MTLLALWLGGTASAVAVWWRDHPRPGAVDAATVAVGCAVLLGGAITYRRPKRKQQVTSKQGTSK